MRLTQGRPKAPSFGLGGSIAAKSQPGQPPLVSNLGSLVQPAMAYFGGLLERPAYVAARPLQAAFRHRPPLAQVETRAPHLVPTLDTFLSSLLSRRWLFGRLRWTGILAWVG